MSFLGFDKLNRFSKLIGKDLNIYNCPPYFIRDKDEVSCFIKDNLIVGLSMHGCNLEGIPDFLLNFHSLRFLDLSNNKISFIPNYFSNLSKLKVLSLSHNSIEIPSTVIFRLKHLRELYIDNNGLEELPPTNLKLPSLEILDLGKNLIKSLSNLNINIKNIKELNISNNPLVDANLPNDYKSLIKLHMVNCNLVEIPNFFINLRSLKFLALDENLLSSPFFKLNRLEQLSLTNNNIVQIPHLQCISLKELYLQKNSLREFPETICGNKNLEIINIDSNNIKELPHCLIKLDSLRFLSLQGNPINLRFPNFTHKIYIQLDPHQATSIQNSTQNHSKSKNIVFI